MANRGASDATAFPDGREATQDQLDDAVRETLVNRSASHQQPVEDRTGEHIEREREIKPATEVPAPHTPLQDGTQRCPTSGEKLIADRARQLGVAVCLLEDRGHQPGRE